MYTIDDLDQKEALHAKEMYVKRGGDLRRFDSDEILELQKYALDVKDTALYDRLETYWG